MSWIVKVGKQGKKIVKKLITPAEKHYVGYTRRIERVHTTRRICAMTFDDGPMGLPASPDRFDGRTLTDVLEQAERALDYDASGTDRTRQDMLRDLVRENTERTIEKQAEALGMLVRADVTLTEEEYPQPWSATLTGTLDPEQVRALSEFLSQSLGIPTERQTWKTYG